MKGSDIKVTFAGQELTCFEKITTTCEKIVQELLDDRPKTDEAKICEKLHIPRFLREYDFCDFTKETNKRLIQAGLIGHYKITDNQKVEIVASNYGIRIICRAIRRGEKGEAEEVNAELWVSSFEFEQSVDIDARMVENIRRVIDACDRVVHEGSIRDAEATRRMNHEEEKR